MTIRKLIYLCVIYFVTCFVSGQNVPMITPTLTPAIKDSSDGYSLFLNVWELSLETDSPSLQIREDNGPQTLLLPGDASMAQLVPMDGYHPLYLSGEKFNKLRQNFILDHLILESVDVEGADQGIDVTTMSGKNVTIERDPSGTLYANGIRIKKQVSLADGHHIFVLDSPLFNQTAKIRQVFNEYHNIEDGVPVGPPLDIPDVPLPPPIPSTASAVRAPSFPPARIAKPPAPPKNLSDPSDPSLKPNSSSQ